MNTHNPVDALRLAVDAAGGNTAFAARLTEARAPREPVSTARLWNWLNRDGKAPVDVCPDIEVLTGVACELLRPDVNWAVLRHTVTAQASAQAIATQEGHQSSTGTP